MKYAGKVIGKRALKLITEDAARYWWNKAQEQIKAKENMLHNSLITNNNSPLTQYPQQNYTCDNCQQEFQQSPLYSPAHDKQELSKSPTYCPNCIETSTVPVPMITNNKKNKKSKVVKNPLAYFQCMQECCRQGLQGRKISQVAHDCKVNSLTILNQRSQEIQKLNEAYQQIGTCLGNLLKN